MTVTVSPPTHSEAAGKQKKAAASNMRAAETVSTRSQTAGAEGKAQTEATKITIRQTNQVVTHISTMTRRCDNVTVGKFYRQTKHIQPQKDTGGSRGRLQNGKDERHSNRRHQRLTEAEPGESY